MPTQQQSALMWGALVQQPPLALFSILVIAWLAQVDDLCDWLISTVCVSKHTFSFIFTSCGAVISHLTCCFVSWNVVHCCFHLHEGTNCWIKHFSHFIPVKPSTSSPSLYDRRRRMLDGNKYQFINLKGSVMIFLFNYMSNSLFSFSSISHLFFCVASFFSLFLVCFVSQALLVALERLQQLLLHQVPLLAFLLLPMPQVSSTAVLRT